MFGMSGVIIESRAVGKIGNEARVERPIEMQNVAADIEPLDIGNKGFKGREPRTVLFASGFVNVGPVFPANNMYEHEQYFRTDRYNLVRRQ